MSYLQLTRSRRIAIQFGEILPYIDTVSIGYRHYWYFCRPIVVLSRPFVALSQPFPVFSRPFPHHVPPKNLSCPQPKHWRGELDKEFERPTKEFVSTELDNPLLFCHGIRFWLMII